MLTWQVFELALQCMEGHGSFWLQTPARPHYINHNIARCLFNSSITLCFITFSCKGSYEICLKYDLLLSKCQRLVLTKWSLIMMMAKVLLVFIFKLDGVLKIFIVC